MATEIKCGCGEVLRVPEQSEGEVFACPACGETLRAGDPMPPLETLKIPIQGSAAERNHRIPHEDTDEDEGPEEDVLQGEVTRSRIPQRVVWGVFFILIGLVGMLFLLRPRGPELPPGVVKESPQVSVAPADEEPSVRVVLNEPGAEAPEPGADLPTPLDRPSILGKEPAVVPSAEGPGQAGENSSSPVQLRSVQQLEPQIQSPPSASPTGTPGEIKVPEQAGAGAQSAPVVQRAVSDAGPSQVPQTRKPQKEAAKASVETPPPAPLVVARKTTGEKFTLNVGSFKERKNAEDCKDGLVEKGFSASVKEVDVPEKGTWYRVSVGEFSSREEAQRQATDMERKWQIKAFVAELR